MGGAVVVGNRWRWWSLILLPGLGLPCAAAVDNVRVTGTTPTQAVITFQVPDPSNCLVLVSTDSQFTNQVNDTNVALFPGSQNCNRASSAVDGNQVTFVAGLRTSKKSALDGKFYSLALECNTTHYFKIISQGVDIATGSFTTKNPPLGATYPEPAPYDPQGFGNYAWPNIDWSDKSKTYVDPQTGVLLKRMTGPGDWGAAYTNRSAFGSITVYDANGKWSNSGNAGSNGATAATSTGAGPSDPLFIPIVISGSKVTPNWNPIITLDDVRITPFCGGTDAAAENRQIKVSLSVDGGQTPATNEFTITCPSGSAVQQTAVPAVFPQPMFNGWGGTLIQGDKNPPSGTVSVAGSKVTLIGSILSTSYFDVNWARGTPIYIQGSSAMETPCPNDYCLIDSVQSATQLTIQQSGSLASAGYQGRGFGLRIVKATSVGDVNVSFGLEYAYSHQFGMLTNGNHQICSAKTVSVSVDAAGQPLNSPLTGRLCVAHTTGGTNAALYLLIAENADGSFRGETRLLSNIEFSAKNTNYSGDSSLIAVEVPGNPFDPDDPRKLYATTIGNGGRLLSGIYDTSVAGCDYRAFSWASATNGYLREAAASEVDCMRWTNLTPSSANPPMDLRSQITRAYRSLYPGFDVGIFNSPRFPGFGGGMMTVGMTVGNENIGIFGNFSLATGLLVGVGDTFHQYPGRWGGVHGFPVSTAGTLRLGTINFIGGLGVYAPNPNVPLSGPWETTVTAVSHTDGSQTPAWNTTDTGLSYTDAHACPAGLDERWVALGAAAGTQRCHLVKVNSEPCSHSPNTGVGGITVVDGGSGYTSAPTVVISGGGGSGATATAEISGGRVVWVSMNAFGSGYASSPTVSFTGGGGSGAAATAFVEAVRFPCAVNSNWSSLQTLEEGDYMGDPDRGAYGEKLIVVKKTKNSESDIDLWLLRWNGTGINSASSGCDSKFNPNSSHNNGWKMVMAPTQSCGPATWILNATDNPVVWFPETWSKSGGHSSWGVNPDGGAYGLVSGSNSGYLVWAQDPVENQIGALPTRSNITMKQPWAGIATTTTGIEDYPSNHQFAAPASEKHQAVSFRAYNSLLGSSAETPGAISPSSYTLDLVPGTTQVYKTTIPSSQLYAPIDIKRIPFVGWAGRYNLRDYSSPATGDVFTDAETFGYCYAYRAGECRTSSQQGSLYVNAGHVNPLGTEVPVTGVDTANNTFSLAYYPFTTDSQVVVRSTENLPGGLDPNTNYWVIQGAPLKLSATRGGPAIDITDAGSGAVTIAGTFCMANQYAQNVACVIPSNPVGARVIQFDISQPDPQAQRQRALTMGFSGPGRQYGFANAGYAGDAKALIVPSYWADGVRQDLFLAKLPPWPEEDSITRSNFVPVTVTISGVSEGVNARIRFGYFENGPPLGDGPPPCTSRQEACSTEKPTGDANAPFSFLSEARTTQFCNIGCTITIPAISGRVVYYVIDILDNTGAVVSTSRMKAEAVP
jgi:hypothetical protein